MTPTACILARLRSLDFVADRYERFMAAVHRRAQVFKPEGS
jgi:hypothetical protein